MISIGGLKNGVLGKMQAVDLGEKSRYYWRFIVVLTYRDLLVAFKPKVFACLVVRPNCVSYINSIGLYELMV